MNQIAKSLEGDFIPTAQCLSGTNDKTKFLQDLSAEINWQVDIRVVRQWLDAEKWMFQTSQGKLPKYLAKSFKNEGITVDNNRVGRLVSAHWNLSRGEYLVESRNGINWGCGEFGDNGSCFWGDNEGAQEMIYNSNGGGIVVYKKLPGGGIKGCARMLYLPHPDTKEAIVMFNEYGKDEWFFQDLVRQRGYLTGWLWPENNGRYDGVLYFNQAAMVVSKNALFIPRGTYNKPSGDVIEFGLVEYYVEEEEDIW